MIKRIHLQVLLTTVCLGLLPGLLTACKVHDSQYEDSLIAKRSSFQRLQSNLSVPLEKRIQKIPDDFLKMTRDYDRSIGIDNAERYAAREISADQLKLFQSYIDLLPPVYRKVFSSKLLAVYFIDNFSGAGMTEWVIDREGRTYYYLILNSSLLDTSLDDWLSYKDDSQFDQSATFPSVRVKTNTQFRALMYGLLHEGAHIVDYELGVTPYVDQQHQRFKGRTQARSDFTDNIWLTGTQPVEQFDLKHRKEINTYGIFSKRGLIPRRELPDMFALLAKSPFVSFYSSTTWSEDLADFITYSHIEKYLGGAMSVELLGFGKILERYAPLNTPSARQREKFLRIFYE
jgi:hypothetical protein